MIRNDNRRSIVLIRAMTSQSYRVVVMVFSTYKLQQNLFYFFQGYKSPTIAGLLRWLDTIRMHVLTVYSKFIYVS